MNVPISQTLASLLLMFSSVAALSQVAERSEPLPKDSRAMAVVQPALSVIGRGGAATDLDVEIRGTALVPIKESKTADVVIRCKGPRFCRSVFTRENSERTVLLNNGRVFFIEQDGKSRRLHFQNTAGARVLQIPALSLLAEYQDPEVQVDYFGRETVGSEPTEIIGLSVLPAEVKSKREKFREQTLTKFFISPNTGLVLKAVYEQVPEDGKPGKTQVEVAFMNYKQMDGMWVPTRQVTSVKGRVVGEFVVNSVTFNVGVSESEFALPKREQK